ncbi:phist protein [Plasmodium cynomolgi strain B]|uniref:Phist protein n=1 Tax=Plasmodium cynomolgi (strain B) TaxID=1120755 RepID=K6V7J7_PLACD|nr:phist protein [Plasmodium cynomolgi strain B]GAB65082.1 phist protein [Plasmodium cynomolgi strain B]
MAFPTFKSVLSVALLYVLYQGNNEYDAHTISEWKNSKRSRNLSEFFPQQIGRSGENYGDYEYEQHYNAELQKRNYNRTEATNIMDLFQDVNIAGNSWDNFCSQNEKFDIQYWENQEDPYEQASSFAQEAYEIPAEDPYINTAPTSIKQYKKTSKGTSKTRNSENGHPLEGRNIIHRPTNKKHQVHIIDARNIKNTETSEESDFSTDPSIFKEQLSDKQLKEIIKNLKEIVTPQESVNIYNQVTAKKKNKFYEALKNLSIFWEDLAKQYNIPYSYVVRQWCKVYSDLSFELLEAEKELFYHAMDLSCINTIINIQFAHIIRTIEHSWEEFIFKKENDTKDYFRKKVKDFYKKEYNTSWF